MVFLCIVTVGSCCRVTTAGVHVVKSAAVLQQEHGYRRVNGDTAVCGVCTPTPRVVSHVVFWVSMRLWGIPPGYVTKKRAMLGYYRGATTFSEVLLLT